ncbi:hypothetical protein K435DRAFT_573434, partial [Dendrothele bispora CBS 962.96]
KPKVDPSKFAWVGKQASNPTVLSADLEKTRQALENWGRDKDYTLSSIKSDPDCPQFPNSEWKNLIAGKPVEFDHILSSVGSASFNDKQTQRLGELEIRFGSATPIRKVSTHGEWTICWDLYFNAVTFLMPWRASELNTYRSHITNLFSAHADSSYHINVINYDKAVRIRVSERRNLLLSEIGSFTDLFITWIQLASVNYIGSSGSRSYNSSNQRKTEVCKRYNFKSCPHIARNCRYLHVCSICRGKDHVRNEC